MRVLAFFAAKQGVPSNVSYASSSIRSTFNISVENFDIESYEGKTACSTYGVSSFPAFVAVANSGMILQKWQGGSAPTMDELRYYIERNN